METIWAEEEDCVYVGDEKEGDEEEQDQEQWFQMKFWQLAHVLVDLLMEWRRGKQDKDYNPIWADSPNSTLIRSLREQLIVYFDCFSH